MSDWKEKAISLAKEGELSWRGIARKLGVPRSTVSDFLRPIKDKLDKQDKEFNGAKILIFDIETAPELYFGFGRYKQNIQEDFVVRNSFLMSFVAKWLNDTNIVSFALPYYEEHYKDSPYSDELLAKDLHKLLNEADIVVAHNLSGFDWKVANTRFVYWGLDPISPTKLVDTLNIARANFKFPTNRLDTIARYLGVGQKLPHTGAKLWRDCYMGDEKAWKLMVDYNTVDVTVLEEVYLKLRAYDKRHPNVALWYDDKMARCVCCGSTNLRKTNKKAYTSVSSFDVYQCGNCGKHNRTRKNTLEKDKRDSLLMNVQ